MSIGDVLAGRGGVPPFVVALARGALEVAVLAGLAFFAVELTRIDWGEAAVFSPVAAGGIRWLEGLADQWIDPSQNRAQPRGMPPPGEASVR